METFAIVLTVFGSLFGVVFVITYFLSKNAERKLEALVKIVEHGGEVQPNLLAQLSESAGATGDMRKGLIWLAIGIPLTLAIGVGEGWDESLFGAIPVFIGIAYLVVMRYGHKGNR